MTAPAGPRRPRKRPKPKQVNLNDGNFLFLSAEQDLEAGSEIFVCTNEEPAEYDHLETGAYTTESGVNFNVIDGIIQ